MEGLAQAGQGWEAGGRELLQPALQRGGIAGVEHGSEVPYQVVGAVQAQAEHLPATRRDAVTTCARYLTGHLDQLHYDTALKNGWPIATGAVEGACRHVIADRLDITGARWGLVGAEAVLQLRALITKGDFEDY